MAGLCEGGKEPSDSLKASNQENEVPKHCLREPQILTEAHRDGKLDFGVGSPYSAPLGSHEDYGCRVRLTLNWTEHEECWTDSKRNEAVLERVSEERMMLNLFRKKKNNLFGSLAKKKLPTEGCIGRNGKREKSSGQKNISDDRRH
ncbi:hypothetical protein ANN_08066 [Periplaneta americana]|uniref:Uncharacterized protein n=1 Tax=Periplaneta americana TaxID=6978 RepID=A0ABQ8T2L9_PERAM|nr:hypothetical protein ANN_08066 [Periplaneta americana]